MKSIADFKRAMILGTTWEANAQYIGDFPSSPKTLGVRDCGLNNTVGFGFITESGSISHSDWPKKSEFSVQDGVVTIEKEGFVRLTYKKIK
jgi:hypothetical protein